ncbi:MAG TPA: homoserine dehydrogenase [Acidobacteriaceae bacterium]
MPVTKPSRPAVKKSPRPTRVALIGFGTVGQSVVRVLAAQKFPGIELTWIFNRNVALKQALPAAKYVPATTKWTEDIDDVLNSNADVIIELTGGIDPTEKWHRRALSSGKSVVTANKQLIAYRGPALAKLAQENKAHLLYGAAVAGGVPVIPGILQGLGGEKVARISGILNGTCNYILSRMETGADYGEVLADAQQLGYAEADPSADVDGHDARAKLVILTRIAMHADIDPDAFSAQSIRPISAVDFAYAGELGCTIRQVSQAQIDGATIRARVAPMLVPDESPIAWSHGTQNMVVTSGTFGGDVVFSGHGAGGKPTAVAVVSDLLAVSQKSAPVSLPIRKRQVTSEFLAPHYLRFVVDDKPGIVSAISGALAKVGVNIDSILQRPGYPKNALPFVVTTEPCYTSLIEKAVRSIGKLPCMLEKPLCLQILEVADKE